MGYVRKYKQTLTNNELKDTLYILVYHDVYNDREIQKKINDLVKQLDFVKKYEKEKDLIYGKRWSFSSSKTSEFYLTITENKADFKTFKASLKINIESDISSNEDLLIKKFKISKFKFYTYNSIKNELNFIGEYFGDSTDTSDIESEAGGTSNP